MIDQRWPHSSHSKIILKKNLKHLQEDAAAIKRDDIISFFIFYFDVDIFVPVPYNNIAYQFHIMLSDA